MKAVASLAAILMGAVLLTGCKPGFDIELAPGEQQLPSPRFVVTSRDRPDARPEYHTVQLLDPDSTEVLWHLRAAPFGTDASLAELTYGETPDGFDVVVPPVALAPGGRYVLVVSGAPRGQLRFRVNAEGRLAKDE